MLYGQINYEPAKVWDSLDTMRVIGELQKGTKVTYELTTSSGIYVRLLHIEGKLYVGYTKKIWVTQVPAPAPEPTPEPTPEPPPATLRPFSFKLEGFKLYTGYLEEE